MNIEILQEDITRLEVDIVVNAANASLLGGGGVDGAIHRAGGPAILGACRAIRERQGTCAPGEAVITTAGKMPARHVVHTVGPVWRGGGRGEPELLASCYRSSLDLCVRQGCTSIAFPNISTGVYGYPKPEAARVAVDAVRGFDRRDKIDRLLFVCFDDENLALYRFLNSIF